MASSARIGDRASNRLIEMLTRPKAKNFAEAARATHKNCQGHAQVLKGDRYSTRGKSPQPAQSTPPPPQLKACPILARKTAAPWHHRGASSLGEELPPIVVRLLHIH